jgi:hypothetical protein
VEPSQRHSSPGSKLYTAGSYESSRSVIPTPEASGIVPGNFALILSVYTGWMISFTPTPRKAICRLQQLYTVEVSSVFNSAEASLIDIR